jgi:hypothetical protein
MVFGALRDIIVYSLEFVEDILYRLHHDGLQRARERVGIIRIVLSQHKRRLGLWLDGLAARLSLQDEIRDRELGGGRGGLAFGRVVVFFPDVVEQPADGISDRMFCGRFVRASFH